MNAYSRFQTKPQAQPRAKRNSNSLAKRITGATLSLSLLLVLEFFLMKLVFAHT
jgi:hypothetical protein